ncbi:glutamate receptor ionotropic, delta-1-like [Centruroides vittatus]|uniref:glutamate receptor ionotropic, delta-1-like n=1 Tax=Centruroides vittatus TaxID=120091 RepID=UPI00350EDF67
MVAAELPFYVDLDEKKNEVVGGIDVKALNLVFNKLNCVSYEILHPETIFGMEDENGSWNGLFGKLQRQEADFSLNSLYITPECYKIADFSVAFDTDETIFIVSSPKEVSKLRTIFRPFSITVWISLFATIIITGIALYFIHSKRCIQNHKDKQSWCINKILWFLFANLISQGGEMSHVRNSTTRITIGAWLLITVVLISGYCGVLFSHMTYPLYESIPTTIEELADSVMKGEYSCGAPGDSSLETYILETNERSVKIFGDHLRKHPENLFTDLDAGIQHVLDTKYAFFCSKSVVESMVRIRGEEQFAYSKDFLFNYMVSYPRKKTFEFKYEVDEIIGWIRDTGIYKKMVRDIMPPSTKEIAKDTYNPLSIDDVLSCFILLAAGYAFSIVAFVIELLYNRTVKH